MYDEQIYFNPCDFELFAERSKLKEKSGDKIGAIEDYKWADNLNDEYMSVINVFVVGTTLTSRVSESAINWVNRY